MNLLAHSYLGRNLPLESKPFNVLWDFASQDYLQDTREHILRGRKMHVAIDHQADEQPYFLACRSLISLARRKMSPVLIDIFCDYLLIQQWNQFSDLTIDQYTHDLLNDLKQASADEGGELLNMAHLIEEQGWFNDYKSISGIGRVLQRLAHRASPRGAALLSGAEEDLKKNEAQFSAGFVEFFKGLDDKLQAQSL